MACAKHYKSSGIGLRVLADVYVIRKAHRDTLNYVYINAKLDSVGLLRFKDVLEQISEAWLGGSDIELPQVVEDEFWLGTVYGNGNTVAMRYASKKRFLSRYKALYYTKTIFLPMNSMKTLYPSALNIRGVAACEYTGGSVNVIRREKDNISQTQCNLSMMKCQPTK